MRCCLMLTTRPRVYKVNSFKPRTSGIRTEWPDRRGGEKKRRTAGGSRLQWEPADLAERNHHRCVPHLQGRDLGKASKEASASTDHALLTRILVLAGPDPGSSEELAPRGGRWTVSGAKAYSFKKAHAFLSKICWPTDSRAANR